jgi:glycosyltransferase involved in cell wall biosynthesis
MKKKFKHGIILPLKEIFLKNNSGAVSIYVNEYLNKSSLKESTVVFTLKNKGKHLKKHVSTIKLKSNYFTNYNYIKTITNKKEFEFLETVEIHNRPNYAEYIIKRYPNKKISLVLHNIFFSKNTVINNNRKLNLLKSCSSIIFVSKFLKNCFFKSLDISDSNNCHIIYNTISKPKKINTTKKKLIVFAGKLNKSKGYDIFGRSVIKILQKHKNWKVLIVGNEKRESYNFKHKNIYIKNWLPHQKLIKIYNNASITVVNPTWEEPFGRTALESSSRGCAVITSVSGGLNETFNNNLILEKNNVTNLFNLLDKLIKNPKYLKKIQNINFSQQTISTQTETKKLDKIKKLSIEDSEEMYKLNKYNILHIGVFGAKLSYRTFNLSLASKISNGLIRNGHNVINYDYRSQNSNQYNTIFKKLVYGVQLDADILSIAENYKPNLILLGHNNKLNRKTILLLKKKYNSKISLWYEDHLTKGDPNFLTNKELIEKNSDIIDSYFITTHPKHVKTNIDKNKINFLPMPVDESIEKYDFYDYKFKTKDLFFGISHGVNRGVLKKKHHDARIKFIDNLTKENSNLRFNFLGFNNEQPKWNHDLYTEMKKCYFALNLSRGGPYKYTSSNRISTYIGNGMPTCVDERINFSNFFNNREMIFYRDEKDLIKKIKLLLLNPKKIYDIGKRGKQKYFKLFNNLIISDYILSKSLNFKSKYKFIWEK